MGIWTEAQSLITSSTGKKGLLLVLGAAVGWLGNIVSGWWKSRDRYRAFVTWRTLNTSRMPEQFPVLIIQSIHSLPMSITNVRVRNGLRWHTRFWPFDSDDPDYPDLPRTVEPLKETMLILNEDALQKAADQVGFLSRLWVPRVYVGVQTMGRGERVFVAERGLAYDTRRRRFQR